MQIKKDESGKRIAVPLNQVEQVNKLAGLKGDLDLHLDYHIPKIIITALDTATELAIAAGLEALKQAKIPLVPEDLNDLNPPNWDLPKPYQDSTGIIFASSFPVIDSFAKELKSYFEYHAKMILMDQFSKSGIISEEILNQELSKIDKFEFNRKLLFELLVLGNSQLAQLIKAKGPNTTINAACASTTQAICIAEDWIKLGRCERVIIVGADNTTSENLLSWIGTGFLILGAASTEAKVENAALPFDARRNGMILGMGAVGLIVESEASVRERGIQPMCQIIGTHMANSAYHGTALDPKHTADELEKFITRLGKLGKINRDELKKQLAYMSHETFTFANGGAAKSEINALRHTFGDISEVIIANTKGFTGHPMGVGIEDAMAAYALKFGKLPPMANHKDVDPELGELKFPTGEEKFNYILRFSAGFGSQLVYILMKKHSIAITNNQFDEWVKKNIGEKIKITEDGILMTVPK
ncbi:MAG: hypothetical protein OEY49_06085 [Candidatus Heimdallarchaeota archaeon]|nr:hypothetical protein [Candidatus Heimdallarchaeota archaeon]